MRNHGVLIVATLISAGSASAQTVETGFLNRSGGEYGRDGLLQTDVGLGRAIRRNADRFPAIVVFPQSPPGGTPGFQALGGRIALAALDKSIAEFGADPSRVYLTGLSMGGNGAWYLAYHHPDRFAAVVVVCGFIEAFTGTASGVRYPAIVDSVPDPFAAIAQRVSRIPIWIFHGDADQTVPVEASRRMAAALKAVAATFQYTELPGIGHNSWDVAYGNADLAAWLFRQQRHSSRQVLHEQVLHEQVLHEQVLHDGFLTAGSSRPRGIRGQGMSVLSETGAAHVRPTRGHRVLLSY